MTGDRKVMLFVDGDDKTTDARVYLMRDTPHGMTELEFKKDWLLMGDDESDPQQWLKNVLISFIETL